MPFLVFQTEIWAKNVYLQFVDIKIVLSSLLFFFNKFSSLPDCEDTRHFLGSGMPCMPCFHVARIKMMIISSLVVFRMTTKE